jgi:hypothetical protein
VVLFFGDLVSVKLFSKRLGFFADIIVLKFLGSPDL